MSEMMYEASESGECADAKSIGIDRENLVRQLRSDGRCSDVQGFAIEKDVLAESRSEMRRLRSAAPYTLKAKTRGNHRKVMKSGFTLRVWCNELLSFVENDTSHSGSLR